MLAPPPLPAGGALPSRQREIRTAIVASWPRWVCALLAALPLAFLTLQVAAWVRNIPNWDEFDTVLDFLIALDSGAGGGEIVNRLLAVTNEHRIVASRLIFAGAYFIFGGVNFAVLAVIGDLFLIGVFGLLLTSVRGGSARLRLAAIFALVVFQLQHHESLFWSGASIDHFFVVFAATAALVALAARARWSVPVASLGGVFATFSLAHGLLVWPAGAALLIAARRWRDAAWWTLAAALAGLLFFTGFQVNAGHRLPGFAELPRVIVYWLTIAGSSPALDDVTIAPWCGAALILAPLLLLRRTLPRERLGLALIAWCLGAMAMIAWGRALLSSEWAPITSRYIVLSSVAWALLVWLLVERLLAHFPRHRWLLAPVLGLLAVFNLAANDAHANAGRIFAQRTETAVLAYHEHGTFAEAETVLYPDPARADALVRETEARRIFELPDPDTLELTDLKPIVLHEATEIDDAVYFIEEVEDTPALFRIRGWAFCPDETIRAGGISIVFRSATGIFAFEALPQLRPDVADANERWDAIYSGFELSVPREKLPAGKFGVGVGFDLDDSPRYMMTSTTVVVREGTDPAFVQQ
ncbi:MAG: hypothetical protein Q7S40_09240 [Opitutaceae bacterium]|nr:hypothetical protein [Opitutaceae bacterium]